jgi:alkanesulfonate monooxygenase SsuD/methylene tetrahydromethanopterin reductase-like flavin-dependent oxidoreductase (luciferase family)
VQLGVTLPTFTDAPVAVLEAAEAAEAAGVHGVFCFDHLWPLGHPERPSLSIYPMLGAVGARTARLRLGSLVARVGLLPDAVVAASMEGLRAIVGERLIAGLGTGDEASRPEHDRNGLPYLGRNARLDSLSALIERLSGGGIECWIGGGGARTDDVARRSGAALNLWDASPERVSVVRARSGGPVTWGGPIPGTAEEAAAQLVALDAAGATWVVWAWPSSIDRVVEAARLAEIALG